MIEKINQMPVLSADLIEFVDQMANSYHKYTNKLILDNPIDLSKDLYKESFVLAAHKYDEDEPRFVFGNAKALELWELDWESFIGMPSRLTAEEIHQDARERLLEEVTSKGYIENYSGIRISSTGRRFQINNAIVWNVLDATGEAIGQAVKFSDYEYL